MSAPVIAAVRHAPPAVFTTPIILLLAVCCGLAVGNSYYAQPLAGPIVQALGLDQRLAGLVVASIQIGYVAGLLLVVPLGDLVENRRLISSLLGIAALALVSMALAPSGASFLAAAFVVGLASAGTQIIVAFAARLMPDAERGRTVGYLTSGIFLGILFARPAASLLAYYFDWRLAFAVPAILMAGLAAALPGALPNFRPAPLPLGYTGILRTLVPLVARTRLLHRRAGYHAAIFGAFSLFWTAVPLLLASSHFGLTQKGIAVFAFAGAAGAAIAPFAGRAGDRGWTRSVTGWAMLAAGLAFVLAFFGASKHSIALLVTAAVLIDIALSANLVLSQRAILSLHPEVGNRLNGLFRTIFFAGGALGSALAGVAYAKGGWDLVSYVGMSFIAAGLLFYLTEFVRPSKFVRISVQHRRAVAELSRMDHHDLKDLGFPTGLEVESKRPRG
jgi:predicted MFS family arabinose efflux permease